MRILQVITSLEVGGAEKLVVDLSLLLREWGHQVDVLIFNGQKTVLKDKLEKVGVKLIVFSYSNSVYNPLNILRLLPILSQYDIVHTHNTACQYYVAISKLFVSCKKTRFITTEHNTTNRRRNIIGFKILDKWMYKQYNMIVSISNKATENLINYIGKKLRVTTIFNGINLDLFFKALPLSSERIPDYKPNDFIICMVAGFRVQKDQDTLIKSLIYLPENFKLWLVGDGVRRNDLEILVSTLELRNRVVFWGIQSDIPSILKSSNVIVMSSHWEGLSLSSIEGMSVGKPFIASSVDGLLEITENYGILFPHQDSEQLASIIKRISEDRELYDVVAKRCLERAKQFDIESTCKEYVRIYELVRSKELL